MIADKLKVIIAGATGMVGKGCLLECMDNPLVESILIVNRKSLGLFHPKVKEVLVQDFNDLSSVREKLAGYNTCFYAIGVTSAGMKEAAYTRVIHDLTIVFAKEVLAANPDITFCFVSGAGTDSSEQSNTMWARVKGKTENALMAMGFKHAYMFRPGYIHPMRGIKSRTAWYNIFYKILGPVYFLLRRIPKFVTNTETLAKAMINVSIHGYAKTVLESEDINTAGYEA